jgi:hypothetical protein
MKEGTDRSTNSGTDAKRAVSDADDGRVEAVGTYETADAVVFYDTENPLAWVQTTAPVSLDEMA